MSDQSSYFIRLSDREFQATEHTSGAWKADEQHIAAPMGLLGHLIEKDHADRGGSLVISRVSHDILGVIPLDTCEVDIRVIRPGRTIELVEATLSHGGRPALMTRAWLLAQADTTQIAGTPFEPIAHRDTMQRWHYSEDWDGGFVKSIETYRHQISRGRAQGWARPLHPILDSEPSSNTARLLGVIDTANGLSPRNDPKTVAFPNLDLTVSFFRSPVSEWVGYDTTVSFGESGTGLTHTVLHDEKGPIGALTQSLTVRPLS